MKIKIVILTLFILIAAQAAFAAELQSTPTNSNLLMPAERLKIFNVETIQLQVHPKKENSSLDWLASEFQAQQAFARSA